MWFDHGFLIDGLTLFYLQAGRQAKWVHNKEVEKIETKKNNNVFIREGIHRNEFLECKLDNCRQCVKSLLLSPSG